MWTRAELKAKAKEVLRGSYWKALLVSLIIAITNGGSGSGGGRSTPGKGMGFSEWVHYLPMIIGIVLVVAVIALAFRIFLGYHLEVGGRRYFIRSAQNDVNLGYLGYGFKEWYVNIIKAMLFKGVLNFLWFLLLIVPGIVKYYAYRMVPYILADNPNINYRRALELSMKMTDGQKMDIFVLDLSFLGWYLLGLLACLVGVVFVLPYQNATEAELYLKLRENALAGGLCNSGELSMNEPF